MWTISQIKENGKMYFKSNYWYTVIVALVLTLCVGESAGSASNAGRNSIQSSYEEIAGYLTPTVMAIIISAVATAVAFSFIIKVLVLNTLEVGCQKFFLTNRSTDNALLGEMAHGFKTNWVNIAITMFLKDLFIGLWTLLFLIPGLIKCYSYRLVPYILAEDPNMNWKEAITLSRQMMDGYKMKAFLYDLSFIGWYILSAITAGIVLVFYVAPYKACSDAELYTAIKENYNPGTF